MGMSPMTGTTMGGSPAVAGIAIPGIGLTELTLNNWDLTPIRVIGDFPEASVGDQLNVVSLPEDTGFAREVTVLGLDESVQMSDGSKLDHLLKLTESTATVGALVTNGTGDHFHHIRQVTVFLCRPDESNLSGNLRTQASRKYFVTLRIRTTTRS